MADEKEMSFLDHLAELRTRLLRALIAVAIFTLLLFSFKSVLMDILFGPASTDFITFRLMCSLSHKLEWGDQLCIADIPYTLQSVKIAGPFFAHMTSALIGGIVLAFPYIFYQIWQFISPGLRQTERKAIRGIGFYVSLLFFLGVTFGYFILVPISTLFLGGYDFGVENIPDLRTYTKLLTGLSLATGFMFQLPVVIYFMTKAGMVTPKLLKKFRRHALVVVLIVSAIITPPDVTSQILVACPVLLLYELSIIVSGRVVKRREASALE